MYPLCVLSFAEHHLWGCPIPQYLQFSICFCLFCLMLSYFCLSCLRESKSLGSLILFSTSFNALWASTLWAHTNTSSLVVSSIFSNTVISLGIPLIMPSLSYLWMNCSMSLLSHLLHSQSAALVCNLPIHLWPSS